MRDEWFSVEHDYFGGSRSTVIVQSRRHWRNAGATRVVSFVPGSFLVQSLDCRSPLFVRLAFQYSTEVFDRIDRVDDDLPSSGRTNFTRPGVSIPNASRNSFGIVAWPREDTDTTFSISASLILFRLFSYSFKHKRGQQTRNRSVSRTHDR